MHPSLYSKFEPPPLLDPKNIMGRNEFCWCGSGKKWKKCHKDRHLQKETPIGKLLKDTNHYFKHGVCLYPQSSKESCSNKTIEAHTIQRAGGLRAIAENGHVLSCKKGVFRIFQNEGEIIPESIGIGDASSFMGFCSFHDNCLFEPIEKKAFTLDDETAFLLAFRALSYEYLSKLNAINALELQRDIDKGKDFEFQVYIQNYLNAYHAGLQRGLRDLRCWKSDYDKMFITKDYSALSHYTVEFEGILPIVCCGGFHPEVDFNGNITQIITRGNHDFEHVLINISVISQKSFLAFVWHGNKNGPAELFVKSFKAIRNDEKANAALILAVEQIENTYFKPSWWKNLCASHKKHITDRMRSGIADQSLRATDTYMNLINILSNIKVSNEIGKN